MKSYIGIDISKLTLDIDDYGKATSCNNDDQGIKIFIRKLKRRAPKKGLPLLIVEASGGYEKRLVNACHQANIPIHVCHANKVRAFAKSKGVLAKTDQIDARKQGIL